MITLPDSILDEENMQKRNAHLLAENAGAGRERNLQKIAAHSFVGSDERHLVFL